VAHSNRLVPRPDRLATAAVTGVSPALGPPAERGTKEAMDQNMRELAGHPTP